MGGTIPALVLGMAVVVLRRPNRFFNFRILLPGRHPVDVVLLLLLLLLVVVAVAVAVGVVWS